MDLFRRRSRARGDPSVESIPRALRRRELTAQFPSSSVVPQLATHMSAVSSRYDGGSHIFNLEWRPDGNVLVAVGDDGTVRMYDPFNKKVFHKIESAHNNSINVARFIGDNLLVTGSDDETLKLFDVRFPTRCLNTFHGHSGWVKNVELFGEGKLISTAFDGTIRLWDIGGEYPENRNTANVLFQHNGIARITYFKGEYTGGPLMQLEDEDYDFAPASASSSRLVISLTNGCIVVFHNLDISTPLKQEELINTDVTELCDFLDGGVMSESIESPPPSELSDASSDDDDNADMPSSPAPASPSPFVSPFFPSSPAMPIPLSSSPIPFAPISFSPSPSPQTSQPYDRYHAQHGLDLPDLVSSSPPSSPPGLHPMFSSSSFSSLSSSASSVSSSSSTTSPLPRPFLRKTNRVEILWEPDQLGYSTSLQMSPCGRYLLTRRHMTRDGSEICCVFDMDQEATLVEKLRRDGTSTLTPEEEAILSTPRGLARVFPNRLVHLFPDSSSGMGYIKEPCFSSHDPYFICSPYYKGLRLFRLEQTSAQRSRPTSQLRHPSSLRPRRGWALLNTHQAPVLSCRYHPHYPMLASGGLDGKVVFYMGGQDLYSSVSMRT